MKQRFTELLHARLPWLFCAIMLAIYGVIVALGGVQKCQAIYYTFGISREQLIHGKIWTLLTHPWLHGNWSHVILNAVFTLFIGTRVEIMAGRARLLTAVFLGSAAGGIGHVLLEGKSDHLLVGFSGAAMCLLLLVTTISPDSRMFPLPISAKNLGLGVLISSLAFTLMNPSLQIPFLSNANRGFHQQEWNEIFKIGHACHLFGGLAGLLYGKYILRPRITLAQLQAERRRKEGE